MKRNKSKNDNGFMLKFSYKRLNRLIHDIKYARALLDKCEVRKNKKQCAKYLEQAQRIVEYMLYAIEQSERSGA